MSDIAYVHHRYGKFKLNGPSQMQTRSRNKREKTISDTKKVISDKLRYLITRFKGESNEIYTDHGEIIEGDHKDAWQFIENEARQIADFNKKGKGRETGYVYDSVINTGDLDKLSDQDLHIIADQYLSKLREEGYKVSACVYAIHSNTQHKHVHIIYVTHKTIQKRTSAKMRGYIREVAEHQKSISHSQEHAI